MKAKVDGHVTNCLKTLLAILLAIVANRIANKIHKNAYIQNLPGKILDKLSIPKSTPKKIADRLGIGN